MPIIGNNVIETGGGANPNISLGHRLAAQHYTAIAGDEVTTLNWYGGQFGFLRPASIQVAIYTVTSLIPVTRIHTAHTFVTFSGTLQWHSVTLPTPIPLVAGVTYTICFAVAVQNYNTVFKPAFGGASQDTSTTLPATWSELSLSGRIFSMYADVVSLPPAAGIIYPCCAQLITP